MGGEREMHEQNFTHKETLSLFLLNSCCALTSIWPLIRPIGQMDPGRFINRG